MSVESAARIIRVWDPALVPLLLRTPAYARAVEDALRTGLSPAMRERRTLQIHPEGAPPHPLTGVPALSLCRAGRPPGPRGPGGRPARHRGRRGTPGTP
ncbi:Scr1 family TA system antitoxin-like transcriptional regulator [Streptomyces olivaceus]|uniref:Scr1 family TA system antitoxin-like transcriptional regulator n=1 Tax=Streptomyces olivaceus TaxID=47716 RepID=UPI001CC99A38|nr:Scr1 family TA system antitoxin-like transcriptional regulator [Streptomyces olivaceus]